ncbi:MAG: NADH-quinone oxidoreductase subunit NuoH [Euryarchaeota archaeon]|nr:NADH-quinone oxidoreductase subunit NuoH [Euryarchaeota archaeon]
MVSLEALAGVVLAPLLELIGAVLGTVDFLVPPLVPLTQFARGVLQHPLVNGLLIAFIEANILLIYITLIVLAVTWLERKLMGRLQDRRGPMQAGKFGLLQPIADMVKFLGKEDLIPRKADGPLFTLAVIGLPCIAFVPLALIPMSEEFVAVKSPVALLLVFAIFSLGPLWVFVGGWAANNKYTLLGAMRGAAQMIAFEIPLVLSTVGIVMLTGSLNPVDIVRAQANGVWFAFVQPLGFFAFLVGMIAEVERLPFDIPEAEAELVAGWNTEYSGMKFALGQFAEFARLYVAAALLVLLFLGGWNGPILPAELWFILKTMLVLAILIWGTRVTFPRLRVDQLLSVGWRRFLPLSLLNILLTLAILATGWRPVGV